VTTEAAVRALTVRQVRRGALVLGVVIGVTVASNVAGYVAAYPTTADRLGLAQSLTDPGVTALLGPPVDLLTAAGYTGWRMLGFFQFVTPVWALLVSTRVLRGDEETGRWGLLLAGPSTARRLTAATCTGLLVALGIVWVLATVGTLVGGSRETGFTATSSAFFGLALVSTPAFFLMVGAVTSQVVATRRAAAATAGAVLGLAFLLRLVSGSTHDLSWLRWSTPLGWADALHPLAGSNPWPLLLFAAAVVVLGGTAAALAGRRDEGASLVPDRVTARPRTALLGGVLGLSVRLTWRTAAGWLVGMAFAGFVVGLVARGVAESFTKSHGVGPILDKLGVGVGIRAYLGLLVLVFAAALMTTAASRVGATREEEARGYLEHLVVRPVPRVRWLSSRVVVDVVVLLAVGVAAGLAMDAGVAVRGGGVALHELVDAGLTMVPPALVVLGIGVLVLGFAPRWAAPVAYAVVAWSFLVQIVVALLKLPNWLLDTSLLHHMALVPGQPPRWDSSLVMTLVALVCIAVGAVGFRRRDLAAA
jgi:ABC-2 type transport system permease protein